MSNGTYLDRLFNGAQPSWKTLGDLGTFTYGYAEKANDIGDARFIRITDIDADGKLIPHSPKYVEISKESERFLLKKNDLLVARTGATFGKTMIFEEGYPAIYAGFLIRLNLNKDIINPKFYWHFAQSELYWNQANKLVSGGGQPQFNVNALKKIRILLPCPENPQQSLAIQAEIVRVLDAFSARNAELSKELSTELLARRKQNNYCRAKILTFTANDIEWMTLKDVADIGTGSRNTNESVIDGKYPFYVRSQEPRRIDQFEFDETAIITAGDGVGVGKVFHFVKGQYALHQRAYRIAIKDKRVDPKFVFHFMKNNFGDYLRTTSVHASVTSLRRPMFEKYVIPVPPLPVQTRIVELLDKLEGAASSVEQDLPREIELRQKQYAYYRDLLLGFSKPNPVAA